MTASGEGRNGEGGRGFWLLAGLLGAGALTVAWPLARPLAWSALLSFLAAPLFDGFHRRLFRGRAASLAAFLTLLLLVCLFVLPLFFFSISLGKDLSQVYGAGADLAATLGGKGGDLGHLVRRLPPWLGDAIAPLLKDEGMILGGLGKLAGWVTTGLAAVSTGLLTSAATFAFETAVVTLLSFFFIRDGRRIAALLREILPLPEGERDRFFRRLASTLRSVVFGVLLTVAIQALLGGLGWRFVGLPNPLFYGALMFLLGMLPLVGTAIVWVPGALFLMATGSMREGLLLLGWGILVVGSVDNFVRPWLMSGEGGVSPPVALVGILGGLATFGFLGVFLGPLLLALFLSVLDIARRMGLGGGGAPKAEAPQEAGGEGEGVSGRA